MTLIEQAERLLALAKTAERRVRHLGDLVDARDALVALAEETLRDAAEQTKGGNE